MIVNLQRDGFWTNLEDTQENNWSKESNIDSGVYINADPSVYDDKAIAQANASCSVTVKAKNYRGIGCYMQPPQVDPVPYRIKAYAGATKDVQLAIAIGYAPRSPQGKDDLITPVKMYHFNNQFDEMVMVPHLEDSHPLKNYPIAFGVLVGQTTNQIVFAQLSVQRLGTIPPKFLSRTS